MFALIISAASLIVSYRTSRFNSKLATIAKRSEVLTMMIETELQYKELHVRLKQISSKFSSMTAKERSFVDQFKQYEKNVRGYYEWVMEGDVKIETLVDVAHHIRAMQLKIDAEHRRLDTIMKEHGKDW